MSGRRFLRVLLAVLVAWLGGLPVATADHNTVRIGVQAEGTRDAVLAEWEPLAERLGQSIPDHRFEVIPLDYQSVARVIELGEIDFLISDPGLYVALESAHGVSRIATRLRRYGSERVGRLGSLIFTRADRTDVRYLSDLDGLRLVAGYPESFAGWLLAAYAIQSAGGDVERIGREAIFTGHEPLDAVRLIEDGRADAGVLPAGELERLVASGAVTAERFKAVGGQSTPFFPFAHSTPLYPEWAIARLQSTADELASQVLVALLAPADGERDWSAPGDYRAVRAALEDLDAAPYAGLASLTVHGLIDRHQSWVAVVVGLLALMLVSTFYTLRLNIRLKQSQARLQKENRERRAAEESLARYGDELEERIRKRTNELEYLAHYDDLTGLPNRNLLFERLDQVIVGNQQREESFALLVVGLDRIREINNTLGHYFGDMILQQASDLLARTLEAPEIIARTSDDAFVVLVSPCDRERAGELAHAIHDTLDRTFFLDGHPMHMKAQMGVVLFPEHGIDGDTLMRHADVALHSVRRTRMEFAFYDPSLNRHGLRDLKLLGDLRGALNSEDQLQLYYQPKVDLVERRLRGVETLLRWNHPQMGMVSPEVFIPLAEKTGLIRPLTLWVLNAAFDQSSRWQQMGLKIVTAINLSAWNLQDVHLIAQVHELIEAWNVDPSKLEMEITESAMMTDPERVLTLLQQLSELGIRLSIDDFGTGYSSLAYLKRLPVDEVKIDKSFVLDIVTNPEDRAIVKATVDLAHSLELDVIAEGVDDERALEILMEMGCDQAQGYLIGRPMTPTDLLKWHIESPWGQALYRRVDRPRPEPLHSAS